MRDGRRYYWDHKAGEYTPERVKATLDRPAPTSKHQGQELEKNDSASLIDLGDGVL